MLSAKQSSEADVNNKTIELQVKDLKGDAKTLDAEKKEQIEIKTSDVILENVKEQSLSKTAVAAASLKQIKEKIFDSKPKEADAEKGCRIIRFLSYLCVIKNYLQLNLLLRKKKGNVWISVNRRWKEISSHRSEQCQNFS